MPRYWWCAPDGALCAADEPGELVHRGALVSLGYWNDPSARQSGFARARTAGRDLPARDRCLVGRYRPPRRRRISLFRRPPRRNDQDVRLSREPDRGRGSRSMPRALSAPQRPSVYRIRAWAKPSSWRRRRRSTAKLDGEGASRSMPRAICRNYMVPLMIAERPHATAQSERQDRSQVAGDRTRRNISAGGRVTADLSAHSTIATYPVRDGCLEVGAPLTRLAERVGQTPFFVYDRRLIDACMPAFAAASAAGRRAALCDQGEPDAGGCAAPRRAGRRLRRRFAERCAPRSTRQCRPSASFAGPGKTKIELDKRSRRISRSRSSRRPRRTIAQRAPLEPRRVSRSG